MNKLLNRLLRGVRDIIYPNTCPGCGRKVDAMVFCHSCKPRVQKREADVSSHRFKYLDSVIYLCAYAGAVRKTLKDIKYKQKLKRSAPLRDLLPAISELFPNEHFDMVVPVPLHKKRHNERGYNQSELIYRIWANNNGVPWIDLLTRTKGTAPQWQLLLQARRENVRGVFFVNQPSVVAGSRVLLVDDIFTSGATLEECAKSLKKSGAPVVRSLTLAHGR